MLIKSKQLRVIIASIIFVVSLTSSVQAMLKTTKITSQLRRHAGQKLKNALQQRREFSFANDTVEYKFILFNQIDKVGVITLNRPPVNALNEGIMQDLDSILKYCEKNPEIHCMILKGSKNFFSGGADIKEMHNKSYMQAYSGEFLSTGWDTLSKLRKPIIAAVLGKALGGGCELAQHCSFIIAGEGAEFGQPEVKLGTIPGAGGTQFLARSIGKGKTMYHCLTGRTMNAEKAERAGIVSYVVPDDQLEEEAIKIAHEIASYSLPAVMDVVEAVNQAFEAPLSVGLKIERNLFNATFARKDQKEGMRAFVEKRDPVFNNE